MSDDYVKSKINREREKQNNIKSGQLVRIKDMPDNFYDWAKAYKKQFGIAWYVYDDMGKGMTFITGAYAVEMGDGILIGAIGERFLEVVIPKRKRGER